MNIILLSGGSGKRLWPLSNEIRSKQFLKLFKNEEGEYESMLQRVYRQAHGIDPNCKITIATSITQVPAIHNQLGDKVGLSIEPCRRDTFAAIALATSYLHDVQAVRDDEAIIVIPVDPYVEAEYFAKLNQIGKQAEKGEANLVLMGIEPEYPSEKYGYIVPKTKDEISGVACFKEKPDVERAKEYIADGALWNGGVFAYKAKYLLDISESILGMRMYTELLQNYPELPKISFDYAVVEKEKEIQVVKFKGSWVDLGSWNTLTEMMTDHVVGDAIMDEACENVHVINELDVPILAMGLKDIVVSASPDGILVSEKDKSGNIKQFVDSMDREAKFAEKSWGSFRVIDAESESLTIKVTIKPGDSMNYHSHEHRDEVWVVVSGKGKVCIDGQISEIKSGDVLSMKAHSKHTVWAETELKMVEVQIGKEISINDKTKYPLDMEF